MIVGASEVVTLIVPAPIVQMQMHEELSAGIPLIIVCEQPGVHGAATMGVHGA